jgi:hypothetical protein
VHITVVCQERKGCVQSSDMDVKSRTNINVQSECERLKVGVGVFKLQRLNLCSAL